MTTVVFNPRYYNICKNTPNLYFSQVFHKCVLRALRRCGDWGSWNWKGWKIARVEKITI